MSREEEGSDATEASYENAEICSLSLIFCKMFSDTTRENKKGTYQKYSDDFHSSSDQDSQGKKIEDIAPLYRDVFAFC